MIVQRVTEGAIHDAAAECGFLVDLEWLNDSRGGGGTYRVKLYPGPETEQRKVNPYTGRRAHAVCWHGFRDFFRALWRLDERARVRTAVASWDSLDDFEATYRETGRRNVGSQVYPFTMAEACECPDAGRAA